LTGGTGPSLRESFALAFAAKPDLAALRRIHDLPSLGAAWRRRVAKQIAAAAD